MLDVISIGNNENISLSSHQPPNGAWSLITKWSFDRYIYYFGILIKAQFNEE
jgi:hypothetical protein